MAKMTKKVAKRVLDWKQKIAVVDAAEAKAAAEGRELTDEELVKLGYVEDEGGTWGLPIPDHIAAILVKHGVK